MKRPALILPAVILGIALLVVAVVYWVDTASALPSFFPGHSAGSASARRWRWGAPSRSR